ncbi:hypothetical protein [Streptomyces sp. SID3212]|uniref:hypothetical protein n=1 Tax=Streptomyces sp. SID3212 TaxID=2690259 RepID=UPI001925EECD|nr:hypothetical protein [Streptomyces sp. SID3212]
MDSAVIWILGASGVLAVVLFVVKGLLDQVPDIAESWHRAKRAIRNEESTDRGEV